MVTSNSNSLLRTLPYICILYLVSSNLWAAPPNLQDGDILFTGSNIGQGEAIIVATESPLTHCGIAFQKSGRWWVFEAIQPVSATSLEEFQARDKKGVFSVYRLKNPPNISEFQKAFNWLNKQIGTDYDQFFRWADEKLYCSELVWKFYQQANIELCQPRAFGDYKLHLPAVQQIIRERYGDLDKLPREEKVVAPSDIAASDKLFQVYKSKQKAQRALKSPPL